MASRRNYTSNAGLRSDATSWVAVPGTGGAATGARQATASPAVPSDPTAGAYRITWTTATTAVSGGGYNSNSAVTAGSTYMFSVYATCSKVQRVQMQVEWRDAGGALISTISGSQTVLAANTITRLNQNLTAPTGAVTARIVVSAVAGTSGTTWAVGNWLELSGAMAELGTVLDSWFDGLTAIPGGWVTDWESGVNGTSRATLAELTLEMLNADPALPRVRFTMVDFGLTPKQVRIVRESAGQEMTVAGWRDRTLTDTEVDTDWAPALDRESTYTVYSGDTVLATQVITVPSSGVGYLQDPLVPENYLPIQLELVTGGLMVGFESLDEIDFPVQASKESIIGASHPVAITGQRLMDQGIRINAVSLDNSTSATVRSLIESAPILVVRGLPDWDQLPPVGYLLADVKRVATVGRSEVCYWRLTGDFVEAVVQGVRAGFISYQQVEDMFALTGETYGTVQSVAANTTYLDWLKNPLVWSTL